ncbi:hypothetical protein [Streptomyces sp. SCL15-6]|uniref:hypothetical protein n=1 Tax=Streptomyces sp. SCL15-6 TaxID=2967222 RepID=UPI0029664472|nr:hypothetical protein [Streptomyces sp. SCL15-6]
MASILLLLTAVACTSGESTDDAAGSSAPSTSRPAPSRQGVTVTPPELDPESGEVFAGRHGVTRGSASFSYEAGPQGKALIVAVSCLGSTGTVKVTVPVLGTDFPLECGTAEPAVTYNQLAMQAAHRAGTVTVTAPSTATWAITVGRGNTAEQEPPTPG